MQTVTLKRSEKLKTFNMAKTKKPVLNIDREAFIDWVFDNDDKKEFFNTYGVGLCLRVKGVFKITAEQLLDDAGYLPEHIVADGQEIHLNEDGEIDIEAYEKVQFSNS